MVSILGSISSHPRFVDLGELVYFYSVILRLLTRLPAGKMTKSAFAHCNFWSNQFYFIAEKLCCLRIVNYPLSPN